MPHAGVPHQGGMVQTQDGHWFYMAFIDAFPGGRVPVLAPLAWRDGWPNLDLKDNTWQPAYPLPVAGTSTDAGPAPAERFAGPALAPQWEWNHNPDNTKWSAKNGLRLQTATVTDDLYSARNTLTHRIPGPGSTATIVLNPAAMQDGDRAGLAMLRNVSGWIGVVRDGAESHLAVTENITMDRQWQTLSKGQAIATAPLAAGPVWLRVQADTTPGEGRLAQFSYSMDGTAFTPLGPPLVLDSHWQFFMGYRYGIFNYATRALGGAVEVKSFTVTTP